YGAPGNGCGRVPSAMGKAETASRDKNVSGAADSGESRDGGTRAVSFSDPRHNEFRRPLGGAELPLAGRPPGEAGVSAGRAGRDAPRAHQTCDPAQRRRNGGEPAFAKCETSVCGKSVVMASKKKAIREFQTVKHIDNSRLVRRLEPVKLRSYCRTLALGGVVAAFFMLYIY